MPRSSRPRSSASPDGTPRRRRQPHGPIRRLGADMTTSLRPLPTILLLGLALIAAACSGSGSGSAASPSAPGASSAASPPASGGGSAGMVDATGDWRLSSGTNAGSAVPHRPRRRHHPGRRRQPGLRPFGLQPVRRRDRSQGRRGAVRAADDDRDGLRGADHGIGGGLCRGPDQGPRGKPRRRSIDPVGRRRRTRIRARRAGPGRRARGHRLDPRLGHLERRGLVGHGRAGVTPPGGRRHGHRFDRVSHLHRAVHAGRDHGHDREFSPRTDGPAPTISCARTST